MKYRAELISLVGIFLIVVGLIIFSVPLGIVSAGIACLIVAKALE